MIGLAVSQHSLVFFVTGLAVLKTTATSIELEVALAGAMEICHGSIRRESKVHPCATQPDVPAGGVSTGLKASIAIPATAVSGPVCSLLLTEPATTLFPSKQPGF